MASKIVSLIMCSLIMHSTFSQELDFDFTITPNQLPDWFFNPPPSSKNAIYAIGISDPLMSSVSRSTVQAKNRALATVFLMENSNVKGVGDNYLQTKYEKYEELIKFSNKNILIGTISIEDSFVTKFGEKILLVRFTKNNVDTVMLNVFAEQYKSNNKFEYGYASSTQTDFCIWNATTNLKYSYIQTNRDFQIISLFNNDTLKIPKGRYEYTGNAKKTSTDSLIKATIKLTNKGLWVGYYKSFIDNVYIFASNKQSILKNVNQAGENNSDTNKNEMLQRNVINGVLNFRISSIEIIDYELQVNLKETSQ